MSKFNKNESAVQCQQHTITPSSECR